MWGAVSRTSQLREKGRHKGHRAHECRGGRKRGGTIQGPAVAGAKSDAKPTEGENVKGGAGAGETALAVAGDIQVQHHFHFKGKESLHFFGELIV